VRHGLARVLVFLFAAMPAVWGTCPRWLQAEPQVAAAAPAACPCCAPDPTPVRAPIKHCDGCPILDVRVASAPAPAPIVLPAIEAAPVVALVPAALAPRDVLLARPRTVDPSGGSPPLVGTVVMLI
jgi:hypothetical protein